MPSPSSGEYARQITSILQSVQLLPDEAKSPILHYRRTVGEIFGSLNYVARVIAEKDRYQAVVNRHLGRLYGMALVNLIEAFERFLKEAAAECVDCLAVLVVDDRFDVFKLQGSGLACHFGAGTLGKALCEAVTWLDCEEINKRFRTILADPFEAGSFYLFPKTLNQEQKPEEERWRYPLMTLIWQIRHTCVHNVGVITQSDAVRLRVLAQTSVDAPRVLVPSKSNLLWVKMFLDDTAENCNRRVGRQLGTLLTKLRGTTPNLIQPQQMADRLAAVFRLPVQVDNATGTVPPD